MFPGPQDRSQVAGAGTETHVSCLFSRPARGIPEERRRVRVVDAEAEAMSRRMGRGCIVIDGLVLEAGEEWRGRDE